MLSCSVCFMYKCTVILEKSAATIVSADDCHNDEDIRILTHQCASTRLPGVIYQKTAILTFILPQMFVVLASLYGNIKKIFVHERF
jgi:hypothetical protein